MKIRQIPPLSPVQIARFWSKVDVRRENQCWPWEGTANKEGRGLFRIGRQMFYAPRIAYFLIAGTQDDHIGTLHDCDNPSCCNPFHLWVGNQSENMRDCVLKGRRHAACGERHGRAKLTERQAAAIRRSKAPQEATAKRYNVSKSLVSAIRCGRLWRAL